MKKIMKYETSNHINIRIKFGNTISPMWLSYYKSIGDLLIKLIKVVEGRERNIISALEKIF
jgi:hypothetical protein